METTSAVKPGDGHKRHVIVWKLLRPLIRLIGFVKFGFVGRRAEIGSPFLLVSNHVTDWDPVLMAASFPEQVYFVASEHLMRSGLGGRLVAYLQNPIARQKSGTAVDTVINMTRRLRKGYNVCVFPEGNRTWDGVTQSFLPSIGKLARHSGASLVTYRIEGGYLASPRWAGSASRRGKMVGAVVNVYSPEQLKAMTPDEINAAIGADLSEDATERQRRTPIRYKGRRLAEHIETMLFLCPKCGRMHTLQSRDDTVRCWKCGFSFRFLPTGFLSGKELPFDNLRDMNEWQTAEIHRLCDEAAPDLPIFTDTDMRTELVTTGKDTKTLARGDVQLFRDRLVLPGVTIPLSELSGIAVRGAQDIYFSAGANHYLVRSDFVRCTVKYLTACAYLNPERSYGV